MEQHLAGGSEKYREDLGSSEVGLVTNISSRMLIMSRKIAKFCVIGPSLRRGVFFFIDFDRSLGIYVEYNVFFSDEN